MITKCLLYQFETFQPLINYTINLAIITFSNLNANKHKLLKTIFIIEHEYGRHVAPHDSRDNGFYYNSLIPIYFSNAVR